MREINHLSIHQWLRPVILDSQQPVSPIGFLFLKLPPPPCAVLLVYTCIIIYRHNSYMYIYYIYIYFILYVYINVVHPTNTDRQNRPSILCHELGDPHACCQAKRVQRPQPGQRRHTNFGVQTTSLNFILNY